jgi:cyclic pyranopterin phosphate synthase
MPAEGLPFIPHDQILSYEEITYLCRVLRDVGISKVRFTGGEPLVRKGFVDFVKFFKQELPEMKVAITTNGALLNTLKDRLSELNLTSINISLDTLNPVKFRHITRCGELYRVIEGITGFSEVSKTPIKLNTVLIRDFNDTEVFDLLAFAQRTQSLLRFIEFMPLDDGVWDKNCFISSNEILSIINKNNEWTPISKKISSDDGPARYFENKLTGQHMGIISAVSHHFCSTCNRLRVTATGDLRPCLFSGESIPLRHDIQAKNRESITFFLKESIKMKPFCWKNLKISEKHMSQIGG